MPTTVYHGSVNYPSGLRPVVTLGNFDGVHRGHRALILRVKEAAGGIAPTCVYTFDPAPRDVLSPSNSILRIQSLEDKIAMLSEIGIDHVVVEPFDVEFAAHDPKWFAEEILHRRLQPQALVLGWDFRFGRKRVGTVDALREWIAVPVEEFGPFSLEGGVVSSSRIRALLSAGRVAEAADLLARPHVVVGTVVAGDRRGRTLGFPTANIRPDTALVPAPGVYAVRVDIGDGVPRTAVANIGFRPTFAQTQLQVEVHILDFEGDLYQRTLRVHLIARLRDEVKFSTVEALVDQIRLDVERAKGQLTGSTPR